MTRMQAALLGMHVAGIALWIWAVETAGIEGTALVTLIAAECLMTASASLRETPRKQREKQKESP